MKKLRRSVLVSAIVIGGLCSAGSPAQADEDIPVTTVAVNNQNTGQNSDRASERAARSLQGAIDNVNSSNLRDALKASIIAALTAAQGDVGQLAPGVDATDEEAAQVQRAIDGLRARHVAEVKLRLGRMVNRVQAAIDVLAATPGDEDRAAAATARIAAARAALLEANTPSELRAVWREIRDIRRSLRADGGTDSTTTTTIAEVLAQ